MVWASDSSLPYWCDECGQPTKDCGEHDDRHDMEAETLGVRLAVGFAWASIALMALAVAAS